MQYLPLLMCCHAYLLVSLQSLQLHADRDLLDRFAAEINSSGDVDRVKKMLVSQE